MTQRRQNRHVTRDHGTRTRAQAGVTRAANARTRTRAREEAHGAVETGVSEVLPVGGRAAELARCLFVC